MRIDNVGKEMPSAIGRNTYMALSVKEASDIAKCMFGGVPCGIDRRIVKVIVALPPTEVMGVATMVAGIRRKQCSTGIARDHGLRSFPCLRHIGFTLGRSHGCRFVPDRFLGFCLLDNEIGSDSLQKTGGIACTENEFVDRLVMGSFQRFLADQGQAVELAMHPNQRGFITVADAYFCATTVSSIDADIPIAIKKSRAICRDSRRGAPWDYRPAFSDGGIVTRPRTVMMFRLFIVRGVRSVLSATVFTGNQGRNGEFTTHSLFS